VTDSSNHDGNDESQGRNNEGGISWKAMLILLALALIAAVVIAYLLVDPFFHQHAP
jgi:hypothetical protein